MNKRKAEQKPDKIWQKQPTANLYVYKPSRVYYARVRVAGKLHVHSLKTDVTKTAIMRLGDYVKELRKKADRVDKVTGGQLTFGDALEIYKTELDQNTMLKPGGRLYRHKTIISLLKSWPDLPKRDVANITDSECREWGSRFGKVYSSTVTNNTIGTLQGVFKVAIAKGARYSNPALGIPKVRVRAHKPTLPDRQQFHAMIKAIRTSGGRFSQACGDLAEFLAYGGFRKGEAAAVLGRDCDFLRGVVKVNGDPVNGTKNGETRNVPMIEPLRKLLERIQSKRDPAQWPDSPVMEIQECQKAIDSACKKLGIARITHHSLRHIYATVCIESGIDIPTVSRWLGHKDGGALAMKVYGHLRDDHSAEMAAKVSFKAKGKA